MVNASMHLEILIHSIKRNIFKISKYQMKNVKIVILQNGAVVLVWYITAIISYINALTFLPVF